MPTVLRVEGYRFFFWSNEGAEPPHVHVEKSGAAGKWWVEDLTMVYQDGFTAAQLRRIRELLSEHQQELLDAWNEHFG
jgi:hypothetical protein